MKNENGFPGLLERFFTQRLIAQRRVSAHTIASYRDTFRLLLQFVEKRSHKPPSGLTLTDLDPSVIGAFLDELEKERGNGARSRNLRLTAIRSFYRFAAYEEPTQSGLIQRILAMPAKRYEKRLIGFLTRPEIEAILAVPDLNTWSGRRDHAFLLVAVPVVPLQVLQQLQPLFQLFHVLAHGRCSPFWVEHRRGPTALPGEDGGRAKSLNPQRPEAVEKRKNRGPGEFPIAVEENVTT